MNKEPLTECEAAWMALGIKNTIEQKGKTMGEHIKNLKDWIKKLETKNKQLCKRLAKSLLEKDAMKNAIEHCKTCSKRGCNICDGILSEEWTGKAENDEGKISEDCWIPVNEKLPELKDVTKNCTQSDWVHVTDGERVIDAYYFDYTKRKPEPGMATGKGWCLHGMAQKDITHWKPIILPE